MSAFMMNPESIGAIAAYMDMHFPVNYSTIWIAPAVKDAVKSACMSYEKAAAAQAGRPVKFQPMEYATIYRVLERMNAEALKERYDDPIEENTAPAVPPYHFPSTGSQAERVQFIKLLECYLYQCSEGDTEQSPLYIAMDGLKRTLYEELIHSLPEYDAAQWG